MINEEYINQKVQENVKLVLYKQQTFQNKKEKIKIYDCDANIVEKHITTTDGNKYIINIRRYPATKAIAHEVKLYKRFWFIKIEKLRCGFRK